MKYNKKNAVILHDTIMITCAWLLAWWSRFNFSFSFKGWEVCFYTLPFVLLTQALILWRFHLYKGVWRFASLPDLWNIFRAATLGSISIILVLFIVFRLEGVPRSVAILYPIYLMFLLGAPRMGYRLWKDHRLNLGSIHNGPRTLILGAGQGGEMLVREMLRTGAYMPVGFLDDNPAVKGSEIHGVRVLGSIDRIAEMAEKTSATHVVIAIPSANNDEMQRLLEFCEQAPVTIKTLPGLQLTNDPLSEIREVSIEDLLGRDKVQLDWQCLQAGILDHCVLVTGAGGSIGSELCFQIAGLAPKKLVLFEQCEFSLYKIEKELKSRFATLEVEAILGDVCDADKVDRVFEQVRPNLIFHAAAYKHVPILEHQPREAIKNNVIGTKHVADAAVKHEVEKFIFISTDKAVNPANILGKSKRIAELYCEQKNMDASTRFTTVRFGNVLDSDGSVIPLFREQIQKGGPVTVTHPEVTRFFMTIPESCQLILQASCMGEGGEIFVLDMGSPVRIAYMAEQMIRLSGKLPDRDIQIEYIGLRPGEKMYEELFYDCEARDKTAHSKIFLARHSQQGNLLLQKKIEQLIDKCMTFDEAGMLEIINELIPVRDDSSSANSSDKVVPIMNKSS